jgi:hypothetical protein
MNHIRFVVPSVDIAAAWLTAQLVILHMSQISSGLLCKRPFTIQLCDDFKIPPSNFKSGIPTRYTEYNIKIWVSFVVIIKRNLKRLNISPNSSQKLSIALSFSPSIGGGIIYIRDHWIKSFSSLTSFTCILPFTEQTVHNMWFAGNLTSQLACRSNVIGPFQMNRPF